MFDRLVPAPLADAAEAHLRHDGVQRGAIVAWLGHNSWDMLATLVACQRLGAVLLPLNWRLAAAELAQIVGQAGAGHLLGTPEVEALAVEVLQRARLVPGPADGVQGGDLLLVSTSGTTGRARLAMHTAAGMQANALAAIQALGLNAHSRVLSVLPLFHVGGLCIQTLPALAAGGQVLLHPRFEPDLWFDAVAAWKPTTTLLVPAVMRALVEHPRWAGADLASLQHVASGSQIVPRPLIEAFHARGIPVAQVYGATETGPVSIVLQPGQALRQAHGAGHPALGVRVRLAADGEVLLRGANLMRGYHREADTGFDAEGWFHTGDLARRHDGGGIEIVGRSKELIISGGENIHPAEIETLAAERPEIAECAVVGVPDARWGEVPVLAVVLRPRQALDRAALQALFDDRLARFKHPRVVHVVDTLPKTALGKVQRALLARQLHAD
ncbi:class I adenylate-forming enzyme family protein [Rubrivivax sp. RP6-9]|uniref:class I adenylate-forming enzyme family protein n=1 Tax=Rubrivivax sp. RP6-9 TaxID=3415750 RepID=UPI003CC606C7